MTGKEGLNDVKYIHFALVIDRNREFVSWLWLENGWLSCVCYCFGPACSIIYWNICGAT
jgi:hypothetical protein